VEEGDVALSDLVSLELFGEEAENLRLAGQENNSARLPVEAVDRMNPEPGIMVDRVPEGRVCLDPRVKKGTEISSSLLLNVQPGGLLHHKPALVRAKDRNGERICCHRKKEGGSEYLRMLLISFQPTISH